MKGWMKGVKRYLTSLIEKEIKTRNESKSLYIQWHITSKCSENCKHCYLDKNKVQSFSLEDSIKIIEMIEELSFSYDNNCTIGITGGDPLVNNSIYDIIKMCHDKGFQVNIKGNPNIITDEIAKLLVKSGITSYQLSIDGTRSTHDNIRSSGSFDRTIKAINIMTEYGIKVGVKYTVSKTNNNTSSRYLKQLDSYIKCRNCNLVSLCRGCPATGYNNNCLLHDLCCWRADVKSNKENLMKLC